MALEDYNKTAWTNDVAPAINATNLLNIEYGIERVTQAVQTIEDNPFDLAPASYATIGGVTIKVQDNGDGTFDGFIDIVPMSAPTS